MTRKPLFPIAMLLSGLVMTVLTTWVLHRAEKRVQATAFESVAEQAFDDAELRLRRPMYGLDGFGGAIAVTGRGSPTVDDVRRYVGARDLNAEFPGVWGIGAIVPVPRAGLADFEAAVRAEGDSGFGVRSVGDHDTLYVIKAIEPRTTNAAAVGFDVGSEAQRRLAVERVFNEGEATVTGPITLVQDTTQRPAALLMAPVFASGGATRRDAADRVIAAVYAAVVYEDLLRGGQDPDESDVHLRILDRHAGEAAATLYSRPGKSDATEGLERTRAIEYFGRQFDLVATPSSHFAATRPLGDWRLAALAGIVLSLLAALAARQQSQMRERAEALAADMTRELERLATVARATTNGVVITGQEGRIQWVNPAFCALTGYAPEEMIGRKPGELLQTPATDAAEIARLRLALAERRPYSGVLLNRSKQGRDYHVAIEIQPVNCVDGTFCGFIAVETDITEQLEREARLRDSELLLDKTGEMSGVGGWRFDIATQRITWTKHTRVIHEVPDDFEPALDNAMSYYTAESGPIIEAAFRKAMETGEGYDLELDFITAKGRKRKVRALGQAEFANGRIVAVVGAFADITPMVEQRERLATERRRLEMILEGTGAGTWEWNAQTGEIRFNTRWAEIVGYSLEELGPQSIQTWKALAHPDDYVRSLELIGRHFDGEMPTYECEVRLQHRDGHWVWILDRGRLLTWTADGLPEWMFGTQLDITERKLAEIRLAENEALLSTTLHSIGDAVVTADAEGRITWINPVAESLSGWTADEAKGRVAEEVLHLEINGREGPAPCPIRTCLDEGRKVGLAGNTTLVSRDGRRYIIEDSAAPLRDQEGRLLGVVMVFHDVTEKALLADEMSYRATHDALTGLVNRGQFETDLGRALDRVRGGQGAGALMFLDLDHFKMLNDACGHAAGDRLLVQIAALMRAEVRARDTVARIGGDEFAILLEGCPLAQAQRIGQKIVDAVDAYRYIDEDGRRFRVGVSVGLVPMDQRWPSLPQLMQAADAACYAAKSEGRGRVVVGDASPEGEASGKREVQWGPIIEQAIDENRFLLFAQRIVPLGVDPPHEIDCEVLLRLPAGDGTMHAPGLFIPAAERYQLASRIDRWVLREVLRVLETTPGAALGRVGINLSGQSIGDRAFHRFALDAIRAAAVPPERLCIEVTETAVVTNLADAARFIDELHALGVQVALDDFGAGSASFSYLRSLKVDVLKIDGQFVRGMLQGDLESAALRSFVDVARVLGLATVAEHVEDAAVAARLVELGVGFGQGYYFHRPEPLADLLSGHSQPLSGG